MSRKPDTTQWIENRAMRPYDDRCAVFATNRFKVQGSVITFPSHREPAPYIVNRLLPACLSNSNFSIFIGTCYGRCGEMTGPCSCGFHCRIVGLGCCSDYAAVCNDYYPTQPPPPTTPSTSHSLILSWIHHIWYMPSKSTRYCVRYL